MKKRLLKEGIKKALVAVMAVTLLATGTFGVNTLTVEASGTSYTFDNTNPVKSRGSNSLGVFDFGVFAKNYQGNIHVASNLAVENWTTNADMLITNQYATLGPEVNYIANYTAGGYADDVMPIQMNRNTALYVIGDKYKVDYYANQIKSGDVYVGETATIGNVLHQSEAFTINFDNALASVENWAATVKNAKIAQNYDWGQAIQNTGSVAILNIKSSQLLENYKSAAGKDVNAINDLFANGVNTVMINVEVDSFPASGNGLFLKHFHTTHANNILWNFGSYAGELVFNRDFAGTIVAPRATVTLNQYLDGAVIATTFGNIQCEIHGYLFNGELGWVDPTPVPEVPTPEPVVPTPEPVVPTPEPVVPTPEPVVPTPEPVVPTPEPVVPTPEPVVPTPEPVVPTPEPVVPTPEPVVPTPEPVVPTPEPVVPTEAPAEVAPAVVATEAPAEVAPAVVATEAPAEVAPAVVATEAPAEVAPAVVATEAPAEVAPAVVATEAPAVVPTAAPVVIAPQAVAPTAAPAVAQAAPAPVTVAVAPVAVVEAEVIAVETAPVSPAEEDEDVLGMRRTRGGVITIEEDAVPLADAAVLGASRRPQTGDDSDIWAFMLITSIAGLAAWTVLNKKR